MRHGIELLPALAAAACLWAAAQAASAQTPVFFAMDTGLSDGKHRTPKQRAETLAELGYAGSDRGGTGGVAETLQEYDARKLRLFGLYTGLRLEEGKASYDGGLKGAIEALKGRDAWIWMPITSKLHKLSDPAGDEQAAAALREIADFAAPCGVRIALYPHTGSWLERVQDAVRLVKKVDRKNVGATLNLCHFLQVDDEKNLQAAITEAAAHLFVVTINGADSGAKGWGRLIQPLDSGTFDTLKLLKMLQAAGYTGPIGLQGYGIKGDSRENLARSMAAWKKLAGQLGGGGRIELLSGDDLGAFRGDVGDWQVVGDVALDPADDRKLASKPGKGAALNGPKGRTRHLVTQAEHGDVEAHIEFVVPKGSNSGVYFQGRYEIQILDSWGVKEPTSGDCGGIYERWKDNKGYEGQPPRVNASRPPGQWQVFDVIFRAPRFDADGKKIANARFVKVVHNGVVVHENADVTGPTRAAMFGDEKPTGPLMLQGDHGPVGYRNIRLAPLPPEQAGK